MAKTVDELIQDAVADIQPEIDGLQAKLAKYHGAFQVTCHGHGGLNIQANLEILAGLVKMLNQKKIPA